jgi:ABC-type branched-subunit amino acid transport system ATPase component
MSAPILALDGLAKEYRGLLAREPSFTLRVDRRFDGPEIIGVMGPNGAGKTTLFEMIAGSNTPSAGRVLVSGQDIHQVRPRERDRLAIHYHQSYQVRRFRRTRPAFLQERARSAYPLVHLFDEPQFNTQDGYIGFMLDFFRRLKAEGHLVFVCLHPTASFQLDILNEICDRFLFVSAGQVHAHDDFAGIVSSPDVRHYLGDVAPALAPSIESALPSLRNRPATI